MNRRTNPSGAILEYAKLDLRCVLRNKRPRETLFSFVILFLCIQLFFYLIPTLQGAAVARIAGMRPPDARTAVASFKGGWQLLLFMSFTSGGIAAFLGVFVIPWSGSFIAFIITNPQPVTQFIAAKLVLLWVGILTFSIVAFASFTVLDYDTLPHVVISFWHIALTAPLSLFVTSGNVERVDLQLGTFRNFQGYGVTQYLVMWALVATPAFLYYLMSFVARGAAGSLVYGLGVAGVIAFRVLIRRIAKNVTQQSSLLIEHYSTGDEYENRA